MAFISLEFNDKSFTDATKKLDALLMTNPDMEKRVRELIRKFLSDAKKEISAAAASAMQSDPRQAYRAVKMMLYKQILGGNTSILNRRRVGGSQSNYQPPRRLQPGQRGGNRVPRSARTEQIDGYTGADRAFILRFINSGAGIKTPRTAGNRGGGLHGNRGVIQPRNFFGPAAQPAMERAAERLAAYIEKLIEEEIKK